MDKCEKFKSELKALLKKYNAEISFEVGEGSDTHGIYDEHITVIFDNKEIITLIDNYYIDANDL